MFAFSASFVNIFHVRKLGARECWQFVFLPFFLWLFFFTQNPFKTMIRECSNLGLNGDFSAYKIQFGAEILLRLESLPVKEITQTA